MTVSSAALKSFRPPPSNNSSIDYFCVPWEVNADDWWTHRPEWNVAENDQNDTHTCFQKYHKDSKHWQRLYDNQFQDDDCNRTYIRQMWSSGYGTDLEQVALGLQRALEHGVPLTMTLPPKRRWWHYSANKEDGSNATCPAKDASCYFLPISSTNCNLKEQRKHRIDSTPLNQQRKYVKQFIPTWNFFSRQQQWLRKAVYDEVKLMKAELLLQQPQKCAVIHVRRADVVLHDEFSRKYFPISAYVDALPPRHSINTTLFLLTDDANAINEAREFHSDRNWVYFNRQRHRGTEGGWEEQIPSRNPRSEVVTILATLQLVPLCDTLVHTHSKFADTLRRAMHPNVTVAQVDENVTVFHANNTNSVKELEELLQGKRNNHAAK
eukprot:CAMPEP_0194256926 /NCGR_PEP_ID=MMETSP0158-20130606/37838_1 /TAXON_ID=33649 /ORGANISM="Thalassionema nitzschioides, Strain L26-B" /LENGTH=379 /DNA_ID=CAMNT_0038995795 /DNA_START=106 /DNA_END=1245 /DNA_ORIENTATION=+